MAFRAVGVLSQSLANALSMILCLVITMGGKKSQKGREKEKIEAWCDRLNYRLPSSGCTLMKMYGGRRGDGEGSLDY